MAKLSCSRTASGADTGIEGLKAANSAHSLIIVEPTGLERSYSTSLQNRPPSSSREFCYIRIRFSLIS